MTNRNDYAPPGCVLPEGMEIPEGYQHWTVSDLIEMLESLDPDARVWIYHTPEDDFDVEDDMVTSPWEMFYSSNGEVFLG